MLPFRVRAILLEDRRGGCRIGRGRRRRTRACGQSDHQRAQNSRSHQLASVSFPTTPRVRVKRATLLPRQSSAPIRPFCLLRPNRCTFGKSTARTTECSLYEQRQRRPKISQGYAPRSSRASSGGTKRRRQSASLSRLDDPVGEYGGVGSQTRPEHALRHRPLRIVGHPDHLRAGRGSGSDRGRLSRNADVIGPRRHHGAAAGLPQMRRPSLDGRFVLRPGAKLLREGADPLRRGDDLLRPADRRRHCPADAPEHPGRLYRIAGLADLRGAGRAGDRRGRARRPAPRC